MSKRTTNYYEGMFVTKGGGGEDAWDQSRSAVKDVLEDHDAEIDYVENWADQQFETEIERQRRGKYVLTYFQAEPSEIGEIKQDTQLNERILRVLILNREKETTYEEMIQERIEANKEEEEEEQEEEADEQDTEDEDETAEEEADASDVEDESEDDEQVEEETSADDESEESSSGQETETDEDAEASDEPETSSEDEVARAEAGVEES